MDTKAPQDRENKADDRLSAQVNNIQWRSLERRSSLASPLHPRFWAALRASAWARRLPVRSLSAAVGAQSRDSCSPCLSRSAFRLTRSSTGNRCRIPCRLFLFGDTPWLGCTDHIDKQSWVFTTSLPSFYMRKLYAQNDSERSTSPCCITPASHDFLSGTDAGGPAASIPHAERGPGDRKALVSLQATRSRASCTMRPVGIGSSKDAENPTADSAAHGIGESARCCLRVCEPDLSNEHTAI